MQTEVGSTNTGITAVQDQQKDFFVAGTDVLEDVSNKASIKYEGVENIDYDFDLAFKLRGISFNPLVDAANPLISLSMSVRKLSEMPNVDQLYNRVRDEILAIVEEIKPLGYDHAVQLSYRYCLCSFIDEMVMTTSWGAKSVWASKSMLAYFHNETWGGEKFFLILSRVMEEPEKYQDFLEFLYLCLSLGFKGQYSLDKEGDKKISELLRRLNDQLRPLRGEAPPSLLSGQEVKKSRFKVKKDTPLWVVWMFVFIGLIGAFIYYHYALNLYTDQVLVNIDALLEKWTVN